ncbi:MAG: MmgE/PrpD family protein [Patulibacter sp.]|nr:MmgE/PrpD family protein [Patulibacter sp.]
MIAMQTTALDALVASVGTAEFAAAAADAAPAVDRIVLDTIAVVAAGARTDEHRALIAARSAPPGERGANVVADEPRWAPAPIAAWLNGTAAVALELDELLIDGGHPAAHVVPAALAVAQEHARDGRELQRAVAAGYEVAARLFRARRPVYPGHPHGVLGGIGAAVAAAQLAGVDPVTTARVAATIGGTTTWAACFAGATARNAWTGTAAMLAVLAVDLAAAGSDGASAAPDELLDLVGAADGAVECWSSGDELLVARSALRRHGVAGPLQSAVQAAIDLRPRIAGPIRSVVVETFEANRKFDRPSAGNPLSGRFSLPYVVAAALDAGTIGLTAFGEDPRVLELAGRVEVRVAADLDAAWPGRAGARVTVVDERGAAVTETVELAPGHPRRPLDDAEWRARVAALAPEHELASRRLARLTDIGELLERPR